MPSVQAERLGLAMVSEVEEVVIGDAMAQSGKKQRFRDYADLNS